MTRDEAIAMVTELRSRNLPRATAEDVRSRIPSNVTDEAVNEVLNNFAQPQEKCLGGDHSILFEWALVHGSGYCARCGFPARGYHYVKDVDGKERRIEAVLQPHPDDLEVGEE